MPLLIFHVIKFLVQHSDNSFSLSRYYKGNVIAGTSSHNALRRHVRVCGVYPGVELGNPVSGWPHDTYVNVSSDNFAVRNKGDIQSYKGLEKSFDNGRLMGNCPSCMQDGLG